MAVNNIVKRLQNIMRSDAGINGDAQRIEQMTWMFFLKVYDAQEESWEYKAYREHREYVSIIPEDLRWRNWAVDRMDGEALTGDALLEHINNKLFPTLKDLPITAQTPRSQSIVKEVFADLNQYMKNGTLLRQVVNVIDEIDFSDAEDRHTFGDIYEGILKDLQSAGNAGEFYTPRALTDFMVKTLNPSLGESFADFTSGTGGFLTSALNYLLPQVKTSEDRMQYLNAVRGQEWKPLPYLLSITNLLIHDVEAPNIRHCDSLGTKVDDFTDADKVDVIAMNPPYGGSTDASAKSNFPMAMRSSETADLFMVLIMYRLKVGGRAAVIVPDGFLFGTDGAKLAIKTKMLREFNLHTIIRLPGSIFSPYTSIATNILFFDNTRAEGASEQYATKETWFYRLDMPEGYKHFSKTKPMKLEHTQPIQDWWNKRVEIVSEDGDVKAKMFTVEDLVALDCNFDQCKFPKDEEEVLSPSELLKQYHEKRAVLDTRIQSALSSITSSLNDTNDGIFAHHGLAESLKSLSDMCLKLPQQLKASILQEAIQGKLVPQDPNDEPASELLKRIREEKAKLVKEGKIKKEKPQLPFSEEDELFELPDGWEWVRLGSLLSVVSDGTHQTPTYVESGVPFLSVQNISSGVLDMSKAKYISEEEHSKLIERIKPQMGDILFCRIGTLGKAIEITWDFDFSIFVSLGLLRPVDSSITSYIIMLINSPWGKQWIDRVKVGGGTHTNKINLSDIPSFPIPLPPLAEQKRIIAKLDELLPKIDTM